LPLPWLRSLVRFHRALRRPVGGAICGLHGVRGYRFVLWRSGIIGWHWPVGGTVAWTVCSPGRVGRDCLRGIICYWRPIGLPLPWLRSLVPVRRSFRLSVRWTISRLHGVRCYRLILRRLGIVCRHGPVGWTVAWTIRSPGLVRHHFPRGIILCWRPIGLPWLRSIVRVRRAFRLSIRRAISRLDSLDVGIRRHLDWSLILGLRTASNHL